jgi:hypothetical protein
LGLFVLSQSQEKVFHLQPKQILLKHKFSFTIHSPKQLKINFSFTHRVSSLDQRRTISIRQRVVHQQKKDFLT